MDSMQMQASGKGSGGQGKPEQGLPDIIMSQEELNKQMQEGMKNNQNGKPKDEGEGKEGNEGDKGDQEGEHGKDSKPGQDGKQQGEGEGSLSEELNGELFEIYQQQQQIRQDRKSTRLNSSHVKISYAVFCLKKKRKIK